MTRPSALPHSLIAAAALLAACTAPQQQVVEDDFDRINRERRERAFPVLPGEGIGPVRVGMSPAEVEKALRAPEAVTQPTEASPRLVWHYHSLGMSVEFVEQKVDAVVAHAGGYAAEREYVYFSGQTPEGLDVNHKREDINRKVRQLGHELPPGVEFVFRDKGFVDTIRVTRVPAPVAEAAPPAGDAAAEVAEDEVEARSDWKPAQAQVDLCDEVCLNVLKACKDIQHDPCMRQCLGQYMEWDSKCLSEIRVFHQCRRSRPVDEIACTGNGRFKTPTCHFEQKALVACVKAHGMLPKKKAQ